MLRSSRSFTRSFLFYYHKVNQKRLLSSTGFQSIGSFHSDNLVELLKDEHPPELPFPPDYDDPMKDSPSPYALDLQTWTFLNHGAFGAALNVGTQRAEQWRRYLEWQPLRFFDRTLLPHLANATRRMKQFVHLPSCEQMTLLPNVTSGMNSVISSYFRQYRNQGHVILWDTSYGSVKKMAYHYSDGRTNAVTEIPLQRLYSKELAQSLDPDNVLVHALRDTLYSSSTATDEPLVILDHVSSNTALTFPIHKLATAIKEWNPRAIVLIDGAHGMLAQPLHVGALFESGVDLYLSNAHKWLSAPRGAAFLAVKDYETRWQSSLYPSVYSHGGDAPDLLSRFVWDGTRDYAALLSLPVVLDFWEQQHPDRVRHQMRTQLHEGVHILARCWHPAYADDLEQWPGNITLTRMDYNVLSSPMMLVKLPCFTTAGHHSDSSHAKAVQDYLFSKYIEAPIKCINGELYVRVSCHIYNKSDDFVILANAIMSFPGFR